MKPKWNTEQLANGIIKDAARALVLFLVLYAIALWADILGG